MNFNVIGNKSIYLTISAVFIIASIAAVAVFGLREGIDFKGGTLWTLQGGGVSAEELHDSFTDLGVAEPRISEDQTTSSFVVRLAALSEAEHQSIFMSLKSKHPGIEELSFQSIGPSVGAELRRKSITALILVLLGISLYIAFAFRKVYKPVSSWKYGWITLFTLFHDVAIPAGLLAVLGHYHRAEIDSNFIVALLVVVGFSVHDTIVVFDRIRENLFLDRGRTDFGKVVNDSVNQTFARSINTSLTLILVLVALYFVGPESLKYFILTLLVGTLTGIYSSIFVASPLLHTWQQFSEKGKKK